MIGHEYLNVLVHAVGWYDPLVECKDSGTVRCGPSEQIGVGHLVLAHQPIEVVPHARQGWKQLKIAALVVLSEYCWLCH